MGLAEGLVLEGREKIRIAEAMRLSGTSMVQLGLLLQDLGPSARQALEARFDSFVREEKSYELACQRAINLAKALRAASPN